MIEWPLLFMAGLVGSSHCVGMCGGFVLTIGAGAAGFRDNLLRQVSYTVGRLFTYGTLGAVAGFVGWRLARAVPSSVNISSALAVLAGLVLVYQGLASAGVLRKKGVVGSAGGCPASRLFGGYLRGPGRTSAFLAGMFTGLLPCGLLYGMLTLAASTHELVSGALTMAIFGIGTAPILLLTGCGGSLLGFVARRRLFVVAAWCLVLTGGISVARGIVYFVNGAAVDKCPLCP